MSFIGSGATAASTSNQSASHIVNSRFDKTTPARWRSATTSRIFGTVTSSCRIVNTLFLGVNIGRSGEHLRGPEPAGFNLPIHQRQRNGKPADQGCSSVINGSVAVQTGISNNPGAGHATAMRHTAWRRCGFAWRRAGTSTAAFRRGRRRLPPGRRGQPVFIRRRRLNSAARRRVHDGDGD